MRKNVRTYDDVANDIQKNFPLSEDLKAFPRRKKMVSFQKNDLSPEEEKRLYDIWMAEKKRANLIHEMIRTIWKKLKMYLYITYKVV